MPSPSANRLKDRLNAYLLLLKKWQLKINLVSNNTLENAWQRHFEDSMQIVDLLPEGKKILFDLGSGAGFPGLVLAMMRSDLKVHLVESDQKKCSFLKTVLRETKTPAQIHNCRIEDVSRETIPDIITARALASLSELFDYCGEWITANPDLILIFPKGGRAETELADLSKNWKFDCCTCQSKTDQNGKILVFSSIYRM